MITLILLYRSFWTDPKPSKAFKDIQRLTLPRRTWRHCFCSGRPDQTELRPQTLLWHVASCGCSSMFVKLDLRRSTVNFHQGPWVHPWTYMNIHQDSVALRAMCSFERLYNGFIRWFNSTPPSLHSCKDFGKPFKAFRWFDCIVPSWLFHFIPP